jgi:UDP-glucuronate 4-epimerase
MSRKILITGSAGFIGYHFAEKVLELGDKVIGLDNINDYYDTNLKLGRLKESGIFSENIKYGQITQSNKHDKYSFIKLDLEDKESIFKLFQENKFDMVCNLAAQPGVRYSLENPYSYINSNIVGFMTILEACRHFDIKHLVYASSSSVYGLNQKLPFSTQQNIDHPISLYAATKKSNELMAHSYSHLYSLPVTGLRFFTVYGPWGRPDMAPMLFTKSILEGKPIKVFNQGNMRRDFTYIDDITDGILRTLNLIPEGNPKWDRKNPDPSSSSSPYKIYNIGNSTPCNLMEFIETIEQELGRKAEKIMMPTQPGDLIETRADITDLINDTDYTPQTPLKNGIRRLVDWYKEYYKV